LSDPTGFVIFGCFAVTTATRVRRRVGESGRWESDDGVREKSLTMRAAFETPCPLLVEGTARCCNRRFSLPARQGYKNEEQDTHHNRDSTMRASWASLALREGGAASEAQFASPARTASERWMAEGTGLSRDMNEGGVAWLLEVASSSGREPALQNESSR
jgi:hypothetical protein